jgi:hypothetical protein
VDADAQNLASFVTTYESTPRPRQPSLSFHLTIRTDDECLKILSVALGTRVRITGAPATWPAGAVTFVVEGIQHTIGIDSRIVEWMTSAPVGSSPAIADSFSRTNPSAFGSPDFGPDWTTNGAGVSVGSGVGIHTHSATGVAQETLIGAGIRDSEQRVSITVAAVAATQTINVRIVARHYDSSNYWLLKMEFATDGTVDLLLNKVLADTSTFPAGGQAFDVDTYSAGSVVHAKFRVAGDTFSAKAWSGVLAAEPSSWDFTYTEAASGIPNGSVGLVSDLAVGNTNTLPFLVTFDDYQVTTGTNPQGVPGPWFRWDESYWDGPDDVRPF